MSESLDSYDVILSEHDYKLVVLTLMPDFMTLIDLTGPCLAHGLQNQIKTPEITLKLKAISKIMTKYDFEKWTSTITVQTHVFRKAVAQLKRKYVKMLEILFFVTKYIEVNSDYPNT